MAIDRGAALIREPDLIEWIDGYRQRYKFSRSDVLKMAMVEFIERHGNGHGGARESKLQDALRLYRTVGEIDPGMLQRHGVADDFQEAVSLLKELVARGDVDARKTRDLVDMIRTPLK